MIKSNKLSRVRFSPISCNEATAALDFFRLFLQLKSKCCHWHQALLQFCQRPRPHFITRCQSCLSNSADKREELPIDQLVFLPGDIVTGFPGYTQQTLN